MPFEKGHKKSIGNKGRVDYPKQRRQKRYILSMLEEALEEQIETGKNKTSYMKRMCKKLVHDAAFAPTKDSLPSTREIMDRLIGKPAQRVEVTGKDRGPIQMITKEMSDAEAARIVQAMIREDDDD